MRNHKNKQIKRNKRKPLIKKLRFVNSVKYFYIILSFVIFLLAYVLYNYFSGFSVDFPINNVGISSTYSIKKVSETTPVLKVKDFDWNSEITPFIQKTNTGFYYFFPGASTHGCRSSDNIAFKDVIEIAQSNCNIGLTKNTLIKGFDSKGNALYLPPSEINKTDDWRFSYDGITSTQVITNSEGTFGVGIKHGEHSNTHIAGYRYQGRIYPKISVYDCASEYKSGGGWDNCWISQAGFANLTVSKLTDPNQGWNPNSTQDYGPVIWTSTAMRDSNLNKVGGTPYHPTLFSDNNYLYVYYTNNWAPRPSGVNSCIAVSRAPVSNFNPSGWTNYYLESFSTQSMPQNFDKNKISEFYTSKGGNSSCINAPINNSKNYFAHWFTVAKVKNTNYYLALEESQYDGTNGPIWQMGTRISKDLVNWSDLNVLVSIPGGWGHGTYSYPTFLNSYGNSNSVVEEGEFYILGKYANITQPDSADDKYEGYRLNRMKVLFDLVETPAVLNREQKLVQHYYKQFLGWDIPVSDPGFGWHVSYLKANGCAADIKAFTNSTPFNTMYKNNSQVSNSAYVGILYRGILGRQPDNLPTGSNWWVAQLDYKLMTRNTIVDILANTAEAKSACLNGKTL